MDQENMKKDRIIDIDVKDEMKKSYIDYAMSVIVGRALPDVRDGLKPVHRRLLFTMHEAGLTPDKPYRKSATVVGDVLGHYHPHGDAAAYETMVKMAQKFAMRYPLVDGQGNFGSMDGDSAAHMRYTEAKMTRMALEMLRDLDKDTVNFVPNYDERLKEPTVLPARYPNLLVNGTNGIAVGMATSIPPHNLGEVIDAVVELIDNEEATLEDLLKHIKGPDFPTGATIMGRSGMLQAYRSGRGRVILRSKAQIEDMTGGKTRIVVSEIPFQVNKARLVERIAELVKEKKIDGITALRDESNRKGIRIVIELRRDVNPHVILNQLYKYSSLQEVFSIIMLSLVDGQPQILGLEKMLRLYLKHQEEVVTRRTRFDLQKALDRSHIVEGLLRAIDHIDEVIAIIRSSYDEAQQRLMDRFEFTEIQAQAILNMQLRRLQGLEKEKLEEEYQQLKQTIAYLEGLLADRSKLLGVVREEILEIKKKHGDPRRTDFMDSDEEIDIRDLIEDDSVNLMLTHLGYIKRIPVDAFRSQKRGGKGVASMNTREEDYVEQILTTTNHSRLALLTNRGRVYRLNAYDIPESSRTARGTNLINVIPIEPGEKVTAMLTVPEEAKDQYLIMGTRRGLVKKTLLSEFRKSNRTGLIAITLREDDELISCKVTQGDDRIIMVSRQGLAISFMEKAIRSSGRGSMGVIGMRLRDDDDIVAMEIAEAGKDMLVISEKGYGKRTPLEDYRLQSRGGKGTKTYKTSAKTGLLVGAKMVDGSEDLMIINTDGTMIRMSTGDVSVLSRVTIGVRLMRTHEDSAIASFEVFVPEEEDREEKESFLEKDEKNAEDEE